MKLTVLVDNNTIIDNYYLGEPAVSYYIECGGKKILFDTGYSDAYLRNAEKLGINLSELDALVLSHAHNDHTGGLTVFPRQNKRPTLVAHPCLFEPREYDGMDIGSPVSLNEVETVFDPLLTDKPIELAPSLYFLGEIARTNDYENQKPLGRRLHDGEWLPDYLLDDSALAYIGKNGLSIITGCSHCGICNILEYAKRVTGEKRIHSVIGGWHLMDAQAEQLTRTVEYFSRTEGILLYPCHCTCFAARAAIHTKTPVHEIGSGMSFVWE